MRRFEYCLGEADAKQFRMEHPDNTLKEAIQHFTKSNRLRRVGITKVTIAENPSPSIQIEIMNSAVKGSTATGR